MPHPHLIHPMTDAELEALIAGDVPPDLGGLETDLGPLPLEAVTVRATLVGLVYRLVVTQRFTNPFEGALEASYVFPLPPRGAVMNFRLRVEGREVVGELRERGRAREVYAEAVAQGRRAAIVEQERADVFTTRVGNLQPGEAVSVELVVVGPLEVRDGVAIFRLPLVVAPRYIPPGDATPDAHRISPPRLPPGSPSAVQLDVEVEIDAAALTLSSVASSQHLVEVSGGDGESWRVRLDEEGARLDRDFVLRYAVAPGALEARMVCCYDDEAARDGGTFCLTLLPPQRAPERVGRDVVFVLDRSGSMGGYKMVEARRTLARMIETLSVEDRFAVILFDHVVEAFSARLLVADGRRKTSAVERLMGTFARGGTALLEPLELAVAMLARSPAGRMRQLVLVTDGHVGNAAQILSERAEALRQVRVYTVGVGPAVNKDFLDRLAHLGGGLCTIVQKQGEGTMDGALRAVHRMMDAPVAWDLEPGFEGLAVVAGSLSPASIPDVYRGVPVTVWGRFVGPIEGEATIGGTVSGGQRWEVPLAVRERRDPEGLWPMLWARTYVADLEDAFDMESGSLFELEAEIVHTSLTHGVMSRFTAFVAVDTVKVGDGPPTRRVVQPVEMPAGWALPGMGPAAELGSAQQTRAGSLQGRVDTMAPELVRGEAATVACDVYSLGCLLYALLTGERLFAGDTVLEVLLAILNGPPATARLEELGAFEGLLRRALDPERDARHPSVAAFASDLVAQAVAHGIETPAQLPAAIKEVMARARVAAPDPEAVRSSDGGLIAWRYKIVSATAHHHAHGHTSVALDLDAPDPDNALVLLTETWRPENVVYRMARGPQPPHPAYLPILDAGRCEDVNGKCYFTRPYREVVLLEELWRSGLPQGFAVAVALRVAQAVEAWHATATDPERPRLFKSLPLDAFGLTPEGRLIVWDMVQEA